MAPRERAEPGASIGMVGIHLIKEWRTESAVDRENSAPTDAWVPRAKPRRLVALHSPPCAARWVVKAGVLDAGLFLRPIEGRPNRETEGASSHIPRANAQVGISSDSVQSGRTLTSQRRTAPAGQLRTCSTTQNSGTKAAVSFDATLMAMLLFCVLLCRPTPAGRSQRARGLGG